MSSFYKNFVLALLLFPFISIFANEGDQSIAIAVHGGAGTIKKANLSDAQDKAYRLAMKQAAELGYQLLKEGKSGEDAVVEAIKLLELSPLFNAGVGAVYTYEGQHELDASIMHGKHLNAGAVAGVKHIKSPIEAARLVMNESVHVMLTGKGAEEFAFKHKIERVDNNVFNTKRRLEALEKARLKIKQSEQAFYLDNSVNDFKFGTVGVVVLDKMGNLVAGTSTGGMTAKRYGRVGDSPIIGAGTYADNQSCAVSATGHGEFFIRYNVAADICARMKYQGVSLAEASDAVINTVLKNAGGDGGVVAIDSKGNISMPFNTEGMYRASIDTNGKLTVAIYNDE
ncbi:isoaspartyl peptidase/L-asparaginase family protein [Glaciecola sp. KUL10]|uniref:isoaspartyl peptidase/L-asparaginase family protein n=1 Tax=Glaciecola sp. (strain KUL10) TaxID=2161813 RepID=UPI000D782C9B|nr:isoaspartyl peptidase/L-asparaginase [Glaciecola sp. KUL10]GBL03059.1 asparaginase family protein [Glaciecola sp. KUL10]